MKSVAIKCGVVPFWMSFTAPAGTLSTGIASVIRLPVTIEGSNRDYRLVIWKEY